MPDRLVWCTYEFSLKQLLLAIRVTELMLARPVTQLILAHVPLLFLWCLGSAGLKCQMGHPSCRHQLAEYAGDAVQLNSVHG